MKQERFSVCSHPDHKSEVSCLERAVGCSPHCLCCMGGLATSIPEEDKTTPYLSEQEVAKIRNTQSKEAWYEDEEDFDIPDWPDGN